MSGTLIKFRNITKIFFLLMSVIFLCGCDKYKPKQIYITPPYKPETPKISISSGGEPIKYTVGIVNWEDIEKEVNGISNENIVEQDTQVEIDFHGNFPDSIKLIESKGELSRDGMVYYKYNEENTVNIEYEEDYIFFIAELNHLDKFGSRTIPDVYSLVCRWGDNVFQYVFIILTI